LLPKGGGRYTVFIASAPPRGREFVSYILTTAIKLTTSETPLLVGIISIMNSGLKYDIEKSMTFTTEASGHAPFLLEVYR
jgi:hypothetical protein